MALGEGRIVDADIRGFFDSVDHGVLRNILRRSCKAPRWTSAWVKVARVGVTRSTSAGGALGRRLAGERASAVDDAVFSGTSRFRLPKLDPPR
jgi:retron-type reverse transcriptase